MNTLSPYHSTSRDVLLKRFRIWRRQHLHVVIYTSLFWIFIDVFFIMLFSDCTKEIILPCSSSVHTEKTTRSLDPNFLLNPKIIINKINKRHVPIVEQSTVKETTKKSLARKWWEIQPG